MSSIGRKRVRNPLESITRSLSVSANTVHRLNYSYGISRARINLIYLSAIHSRLITASPSDFTYNPTDYREKRKSRYLSLSREEIRNIYIGILFREDGTISTAVEQHEWASEKKK